MEGQWIGHYEGTNKGIAVLDIDDRGDHFEGHAYVFDDAGLPGTLVFIRTPNRNPKQTLDVQTIPLHPQTGDILPRDKLPEFAPGVTYPDTATVQLELKAETLHVAWVTSIGTNGSATVPRSKSDRPSDYQPEKETGTWDQFKSYATKLEPSRFIFRGQSSTRRLRTTFHRTARKDLIPFINADIPALHRILTAKTRHLFNLADALQNGAFWNLIQHHGYPTPLLDWSHSPFVAAFFAFRPHRDRNRNDESVRIFMFDRKSWCTDYNQLQKVAFARPHFSILEALAIENDRAIPQQALSSVTNVDDVESYIQEKEVERNKRYLHVFDLRYNERDDVLRELGMMGITAGSLFPGLDGACEELRARFFGFGT